MDFTCRHCDSNLDAGDVLEFFLKKYTPDRAIRRAREVGWSISNPIHFDRSIILQGEQYTLCPDCGGKDPFHRGIRF